MEETEVIIFKKGGKWCCHDGMCSPESLRCQINIYHWVVWHMPLYDRVWHLLMRFKIYIQSGLCHMFIKWVVCIMTCFCFTIEEIFDSLSQDTVWKCKVCIVSVIPVIMWTENLCNYAQTCANLKTNQKETRGKNVIVCNEAIPTPTCKPWCSFFSQTN